MTAWIIGCVVLGGGAAFAYSYLTQPERVFGSKALDCPVHEIEWETGSSYTIIRGCGDEVEAVCSDSCVDRNERVSTTHEY